MFGINFKKNKKIFLVLSSIVFLLLILIFSNYFFKVKKVEIEFPDISPENLQIQNQIQNEVEKNTNSFLDFILLDSKLITKFVRDEYELVNRVDFNKKFYFNSWSDFGPKLYGVVLKNDKYFYACVQESDRDNFLVWAMQGNSSGELFSEINSEICTNEKNNTENKKFGVRLILHPKSIYDREIQEKVKEPDSLSGMRVYKETDFQVLKEILAYLQKNGFDVNEVYVNELKLVDINIGNYIVKINLEKKVEQTISDFETISRSGKLQKYINDDKEKIEYIDLSFSDKVFYKLKNNTKNDTMSTTSTTTNAKEFLD